MGMLRVLAMLGAGAQGYVQGAEQARQRGRQEEADARTKLLQDREDQQYMQAQTDDQAARNAMAPRTVDTAPVAVPIGSMDEPQAPEDRGIRVAGQQYPDQASAQAAADSQNTITARMQRAAGAVQNPLLAAKLGGDAQAAELSGLKVADAKRTAGNQKFDDDAHYALFTRDADVLKKFLNDSHADGKNGAVKFDVQTDPATGAQQAFRIADDGALVPFGPKIANDNDRIQALYLLSHAVSPEAKAVHALAVTKAEREGKLADAEVTLKNAQAGYYGGRNDVTMSKIAGAGARKADHFDEKEWDAALKIEPSFVSFGDPMMGKPIESPELRLEYIRTLNELRTAGDMSPNEAAEAARTAVLKIRNRAADRVAAATENDKKSKLTELQAVRDLVNEGAKERVAIKLRQDALKSGRATADPLGIRSSSAAGADQVSPADQQARDIEAGRLMLTNEFGGDVGRAQAALAEMQAALDKAPNTAASNDAKAALRGQMARLRAGITATQAGARPAVKVASTPVVPGQSAKPVGPMQQAAAQQSIAPAVGNSQEETVLDQARIATKAAHTKLMAFGSSQRTKDPQGYATVAQAYNSAKALEDKAFSAYNAAAMRALSGNRMVPMATP